MAPRLGAALLTAAAARPPTAPPRTPAAREALRVLAGAAFLMATSAIGPGFLTQTAVFTEKLGAAFAFAITASIALDVVVQLNVWRLVGRSGRRAQELANGAVPGSGHVLSAAIAFGGLVFNIGNVAGCALGLEVLAGVPLRTGTLLSTGLALVVFLRREVGRSLDAFAKALGFVMIALTLWIAWRAHPPLGLALREAVFPSRVDWLTILTLVGGTVGGYISFAGAHRLLEPGAGPFDAHAIDRGALQAIGITGLMRGLLFLAVLGVVAGGAHLDPANPPASAFALGAGEAGRRAFGVVLWAASITSVVGASFTSVSFLETLSPAIAARRRGAIAAFIVVSALAFATVGKPVALLVFAGAVNGMVLPLALAAVLLAARRPDLTGGYRHPRALALLGWIAAALTAVLAALALRDLAGLFR